MANKILLIGVDGGATEIRAHAVACDDLSAPTSFHLQEHTAAQLYTRVADFEPVPVADQFAQRSAGKLDISEAERKQAGAWVSAAAAVVNGVARQSGATCVLVGVGMPGLKTSDQRGIAVINNGPRIPEYLAEMEQRLADDGLALAAPIAALGSDADYCGLGEQHAAEGLFRDVENAYYVGGGTGVADALKLAGRLVPFDGAKSWIQKSWQIASSIGPTFEKLISAKSFNDVYQSVTCGGHAGVQPNSAAPSQFPERAAAAGDPIARAWTQTVALVLAELIFERVWTVANGRPQNASRGAGYLALDADHPFRGTVFDRVIVGQRLGCIYADHDCHDVFGRWVDEYLAALIMQSEDSVLRRQLLVNTELRPGFLVSSRLRAAPALGAAVAAARAFSCAQ